MADAANWWQSLATLADVSDHECRVHKHFPEQYHEQNRESSSGVLGNADAL
jgi:hypothetical protein